MPITVPAKLKSADINRFAQRAAQVESLKPALAYWCYYWIVQHILGNGLHTTDDAAKAFTMNLMDKLEEMKAKFATDDAIIDDIAGQAYVEQFGLETFQRADNAVRANKATRQTADTFLAAATFLELVNIWGTPSPEIVSKIKYAKFHALRIAKAFKAGEDPNLSNPVPDAESTGDALALDPNDPEVRHINGTDAQPSTPETASQHKDAQLPPHEASHPWSPPLYQQPSVSDFPDGHNQADQYHHVAEAPSNAQPSPSPAITGALAPNVDPVSPPSPVFNSDHASTLPSQQDTQSPQGSVGGGYFPNVALPDAPPQSQAGHMSASGGQSAVNTPSAPAARVERIQPLNNSSTLQHPSALQLAYQHAQQPLSQPSTNAQQTYLTDDMAVMAAQKHAKFAISALNFEDVPTAVKELRQALQSLGAT